MARRTWAEMMLGKYVVFIGRHYAGDEQYVVIARISAKLEYDCSAVQWPRLADSARAVAVSSRGDATIDPTRDQMYYEALVRIQLGDRDEAIRLLGIYLAANPHLRELLASDQSWMFDDLRDDPAFKRLFQVE